MTSTEQTPVVQLFGIPVVVSAETVFDVARLAACCAPVPGMTSVVEPLRMIYDSVERVSWKKRRCRQLSTSAMILVFAICDHYDHERVDTIKLQPAIARTVRVINEINIDVEEWAALPFWQSWYMRHDIDLRINEHEENLKNVTEFLSSAATLQTHDKIAALQYNNLQGSADRKQAEDQFYRLRSAPGELKRAEEQIHGQMAIIEMASTWQDKTNRRKEVAVLDERHDSEHTTEDPDIMPNPSTKQTLDATTGLNKWTKFVTVVPGQHGRFKINTEMSPLYGGFSDVWQCDAKFSDGRIVTAAVKKFRAVRIARDADASTVTNKLLKRLTKELDIWMALQHPHITPLLGFVLQDDLCVISPWYTNGNVADYIVRHPDADRIKLVSDVASGLAYLHSRVPPVVHGDMKPDNVLIDDAGNAVIIDFGLSAIMEDDPTLMTSLATSSLQDSGNARWMAPELLMEEGCIRSLSTDVYSFGSVGLQIYTGGIPFKDTPTFRIIYTLIRGEKPMVKRQDYPPLSLPSLDWFCDLLNSCWDGDPTSRPSMTDVESTLRTYPNSEGER